VVKAKAETNMSKAAVSFFISGTSIFNLRIKEKCGEIVQKISQIFVAADSFESGRANGSATCFGRDRFKSHAFQSGVPTGNIFHGSLK
jgi:hypothetical protein